MVADSGDGSVSSRRMLSGMPGLRWMALQMPTYSSCLSAIKGVNQAFARFTPNFTPKNVKLGVFVFFKILQKNVNYKAIGISMDWQNEPL